MELRSKFGKGKNGRLEVRLRRGWGSLSEKRGVFLKDWIQAGRGAGLSESLKTERLEKRWEGERLYSNFQIKKPRRRLQQGEN